MLLIPIRHKTSFGSFPVVPGRRFVNVEGHTKESNLRAVSMDSWIVSSILEKGKSKSRSIV
jgi:hypothetical protein